MADYHALFKIDLAFLSDRLESYLTFSYSHLCKYMKGFI